MNKIKVGLVCTTHYSKKHNVYGRIEIDKFLKSLRNIDFNFDLFLIDNQSENVLTTTGFENEKWYNYYYINNQYISGLTGAWNMGIKMAVTNNCDIIINSNDDIVFDKTINNFISAIVKHEHNGYSLYGPLTNPGGSSTYHQILTTMGLFDEFTETTDYYALNGFFNVFTKDCFTKFNINGNFYSTQQEHKWGGQEVELYNRNKVKGMRSFIYNNCFVRHEKHRSWLVAKNNDETIK